MRFMPGGKGPSYPNSSRFTLILAMFIMAFMAYNILDAADSQGGAALAEDGRFEYRLVNLTGRGTGERLSSVAEREIEQPITIRVERNGKAIEGREVWFTVATTPNGPDEAIFLSSNRAVSDEKGNAVTTVKKLSYKGVYVIVVTLEGDQKLAKPINVTIDAIGSTWFLSLIIGLFGGLALFLFGMDLVGANLQKVAGDSLRSILARLTKNNYYGAGLGIVITFLLQSNSATTVILVGLVSATLMTLTQAIGVIIGSKIGITLTIQIIAFDISKYAPMIIFVGMLMRMISSKKQVIRIGEAVMGFGFIFFGLALMSQSMAPLRVMPEVGDMLVSLGDSPILAIIIATVFTAVIQSAAAALGITMALAAQGMMSLDAAIPIGMGSAIGTCATALLASLGSSREGKQVAVAHLIYSVVSVAICIPIMGLIVEATRVVSLAIGDTSLVRQIANGFTIYSVGMGVILLPFCKVFERLTLKLVPPKEKPMVFAPKYLQESSIPFPAIAIEQAYQEMLRMSMMVEHQLEGLRELIKNPTDEGCHSLEEKEENINTLERAIRRFLAKVGHNEMEQDLSARERAIVYLASTLEEIGDTLAHTLLHAIEKVAHVGHKFSEEGIDELESYLERVISRMKHVIHGTENHNVVEIERIIDENEKEKAEATRLRSHHLDRLHQGLSDSVHTSGAHLMVLNSLLTIDRHITDMAQIVHDEMP